LGTWWKRLHRFIYLAGVLILIHALALGTDFTNTSSLTYRLWFVLIFILLGLQAARIDRALARRFSVQARAGLAGSLLFAFAGFSLATFTGGGGSGLSVHSQHVTIAQQAQNPTNLPGQVGDRTKRYSVTFTHDQVLPNQPTTLHFHVTDAATGADVTQFTKFYDQFFHIVIVDDTLTYFQHLHPTFADGDFQLTTTFPTAATYHIYLNFQPYQAIEQSFAEVLTVGGEVRQVADTLTQDEATSRTLNGYGITLTQGETMKAADASVGNAQVVFRVTKDEKPVATLKQYLAAFGHLTLVNTDTYEFLHVHPSVVPSSATAESGPDVTFLPLGLYGPIKPGTYRAFVELSPDGVYTVAPFTIQIQ